MSKNQLAQCVSQTEPRWPFFFSNVLTRKPLNLWTSSLPLSLCCLYSQAWGVAWSKDTDVPSCKSLFSLHLIFLCMGLELAKQQRRADGNEFCQIKHNLLDTICNVSWSLYSVELMLFFLCLSVMIYFIPLDNVPLLSSHSVIQGIPHEFMIFFLRQDHEMQTETTSFRYYYIQATIWGWGSVQATTIIFQPW